MTLEHVPAGKSAYSPAAFRPKAIQLSIFPKISIRPAYHVSNEQIERSSVNYPANNLVLA